MRHPASRTIGYQLIHVARMHRARIAELLEDLKLFPGQEQVLEALAGNASLSMSELADLLRVRPPTASKTIARLAASGLVERKPTGTDGRIVRVALTELGRQRADEVLALTAEIEHDLTAHLDGKDRKKLRKLLTRVEKGLRRATHADDGDNAEEAGQAQDRHPDD